MGTNDRLPSKQIAPAPSVYDIDGIDNSAATVAWQHDRGDKAICYIEVGAAGNYCSAHNEGLTMTYYARLRAAGVLGKQVEGYPERFVNITSASTVSIIESMIEHQCAAKGFDAVETGLDETYTGADGITGFVLNQSDEVTYMRTLANYMHGLGLAWIAKSPDDTEDDFATLIAPFADGVLTEQCNEYDTCAALSAFIGHKAVFDAEYRLAPSHFCAADSARHINGALDRRLLDGVRHPCQ